MPLSINVLISLDVARVGGTLHLVVDKWRAKTSVWPDSISQAGCTNYSISPCTLQFRVCIGGCREVGFSQLKSPEAKNSKPLQARCLRSSCPRFLFLIRNKTASNVPSVQKELVASKLPRQVPSFQAALILMPLQCSRNLGCPFFLRVPPKHCGIVLTVSSQALRVL